MVTSSVSSINSVSKSTNITICVECGKPWSMYQGEREWWLKQVATNPKNKMPTRCLTCRKSSKAMGPACLSAIGTPKIRYESLEQAKYVEERHRKDRGYGKQYAYECPDCGGFHLSSTLPIELGAPRISQMHYDNPYDKASKPARAHVGQSATELCVQPSSNATEVVTELKPGSTTTHDQATGAGKLLTVPSATTGSLKSLPEIASRRKEIQELREKLALEDERLNLEAERLRREEILSIIQNGDEYSVRKKAQYMVFTVDSFREFVQQARQHAPLNEVLAQVR